MQVSNDPDLVFYQSKTDARIARLARIARKFPSLAELKWASARALFHAYMVFCILTVFGAHLTAPLFTWLYFGEWRVWRVWNSAKHLWGHGYKMALLVLKGENEGFTFSVPLMVPPASAVDRRLMRIDPAWNFGASCGTCSHCCEKHGCPILDKKTGLCQGYNSFFWRYFNCGRYPTEQREIDYYLCPKWQVNPSTNIQRADSRSSKVA